MCGYTLNTVFDSVCLDSYEAAPRGGRERDNQVLSPSIYAREQFSVFSSAITNTACDTLVVVELEVDALVILRNVLEELLQGSVGRFYVFEVAGQDWQAC